MLPLPPAITTGAELRTRRKAAGLLIGDLAKLLCLHPYTIGRIERGKLVLAPPYGVAAALLFAWLDLHAARIQPVMPAVLAPSPHTTSVPTRAAPAHARPSNPPTAEQIAQWEADVRRNSQDDVT